MYFSIAGGAQTEVERPLSGNVVEEFQLFLRLPPKPDPVTFSKIWRTWRWRILGLHYNIWRWLWLMVLVRMEFYKFVLSYKLQPLTRRRCFLNVFSIIYPPSNSVCLPCAFVDLIALSIFCHFLALRGKMCVSDIKYPLEPRKQEETHPHPPAEP